MDTLRKEEKEGEMGYILVSEREHYDKVRVDPRDESNRSFFRRLNEEILSRVTMPLYGSFL